MKKAGSYIIGFFLSIALTLLSYFVVVNQILSGEILTATILGLAIIQLFVQLIFFLHLLKGPRWNIIFFISTVSIILIVVVGSLWIMENLNYHMTPQEVGAYITEKELIHK